MNRRGFLTNLLAGAAAVLAVGQMPKVAEASVPGQLTPAPCSVCGEIGATELIRQTHMLYEHESGYARTLEAPATATSDLVWVNNYAITSGSRGIEVGGGPSYTLVPGVYFRSLHEGG